jgi:hypothetical protein
VKSLSRFVRTTGRHISARWIWGRLAQCPPGPRRVRANTYGALNRNHLARQPSVLVPAIIARRPAATGEARHASRFRASRPAEQIASCLHSAFSANSFEFGLARLIRAGQAAGMDTDDTSPPVIESGAAPAADEVAESLGFVRGLLFGLACALPLWAVVIAVLWLAF